MKKCEKHGLATEDLPGYCKPQASQSSSSLSRMTEERLDHFRALGFDWSASDLAELLAECERARAWEQQYGTMWKALNEVTKDYSELLSSDYATRNNPKPEDKIESIIKAKKLLNESINSIQNL
jgi:hypothetical protein